MKGFRNGTELTAKLCRMFKQNPALFKNGFQEKGTKYKKSVFVLVGKFYDHMEPSITINDTHEYYGISLPRGIETHKYNN